MSFCSGGKHLGNMVVIDSNPTYGSWLDVWESNAWNLRYVLTVIQTCSKSRSEECVCVNKI